MTSISVIKRINQHLNKLTVPQPSKKSKYAFSLYFPGKAHAVAAKSADTENFFIDGKMPIFPVISIYGFLALVINSAVTQKRLKRQRQDQRKMRFNNNTLC